MNMLKSMLDLNYNLLRYLIASARNKVKASTLTFLGISVKTYNEIKT